MVRRLFAPILIPMAMFYAVIVAIRNRLFDLGIFLSDDCGATVVSIGNLSAGGTGKTPVTAVLAERLGRGRRLGIVSRGYGRKGSDSVRVCPEHQQAPTLFGDEATWLAQHLGVPVQVGAKRLRAARDLVVAEAVRLILLDDGFQHRWLNRDFDIVLIDASAPPWQWHPLPWGRLRESWTSLRRASIVFLTKTDDVPEIMLVALEERIRRAAGRELPIVRWIQKMLLPDLPPGCGVLIAGIAKPQDFFSGVEKAIGRDRIAGRVTKRDHQTYSIAELEDLLRDVQAHQANWVATTEKDFVKLARLWPKSAPSLLSSRLEIRPARESDQRELECFYGRIEAVLNFKHP